MSAEPSGETTIQFQRTTFYRRWSIGRTQKNGWQPNDMTVSATYQGGRDPDEAIMRGMARECMQEAQVTCDELNNAERFTQTQ
jgi:hypothetical protein